MISPYLARDLRTIPNLISLSRLALLGAGLVAYFNGAPRLGIVFGIVAGLTDYLDGYLARRLGQVTELGEVLDQFSDLMLEAVCILLLVTHPEGPNPLVLAAYLLRELWVSTIRRFMAAHNLSIQSNFYGKLKTNFFGWCFVPYFAFIVHVVPVADAWMKVLGQFGLYGGLVCAYISGWHYTRQFAQSYDQAVSGAPQS